MFWVDSKGVSLCFKHMSTLPCLALCRIFQRNVHNCRKKLAALKINKWSQFLRSCHDTKFVLILHFHPRNHNYYRITVIISIRLFFILPLCFPFGRLLTLVLSLMDPLPLTKILQPVSCSNCLAVIPLGPRILPTKLNCKIEVHL